MKKREITTRELAVAVCLTQIALDIIELLESNKTGKKEKTCLKFIKTYISKYLVELDQSLNDESKDRLNRKLLNYVIRLDAVSCQDNPRIAMKLDDFLDFAAEMIEVKCRGCDGKIEDCHVRKCFLELMVPELKSNEGKPCGYMYPKEGAEIKRRRKKKRR